MCSVKRRSGKFANFAWKHLCRRLFLIKLIKRNCSTGFLCWSLFFNKVAGLNFAKTLGTSFFIEHLRWLFLWLKYKASITRIFVPSYLCWKKTIPKYGSLLSICIHLLNNSLMKISAVCYSALLLKHFL